MKPRSALRAALALDPNSAQAWYNLGLAQHAGNELEPALASFQHAVQIDPRDVDSWYFVGVCYGEMKQFDKAIETFNKALAVNPLHASAEFQLARALQRSGRTAEAKEHFKQFQHLTSTKISAAIGLAYGEQGHYSTVTPIEEPETARKPMIAVKLVAEPMVPQVSNKNPAAPGPFAATGGACMLDVTGSGQLDLVLMESGDHAIGVFHRGEDGGFEPMDAEAAGLKASGHAVACAVGDYDGDGLNDLAVALEDRVLLFRNLGKGKFEDASVEAGLAAAQQARPESHLSTTTTTATSTCSSPARQSSPVTHRMFSGATTATRLLPSGPSPRGLAAAAQVPQRS